MPSFLFNRHACDGLNKWIAWATVWTSTPGMWLSFTAVVLNSTDVRKSRHTYRVPWTQQCFP